MYEAASGAKGGEGGPPPPPAAISGRTDGHSVTSATQESGSRPHCRGPVETPERWGPDRCSPASTGTRWTARDDSRSLLASAPSSMAGSWSPAGPPAASPSTPGPSGRSSPTRSRRSRSPMPRHGSSAEASSPVPRKPSSTARAAPPPAIDAAGPPIARVQARLGPRYGDRLRLRQANFRELSEVAPAEGFGAVDGCFLDLGLSRFQLAAEGRGFGFRAGGPLGMRFDTPH